MKIRILLLAIALLVTVLAACGPAPEAPKSQLALPADHTSTVEAWQAERLAGLTRERGWLTLIGLYWLEPGENRIGTADGDAVQFDPAFAQGELGSLFLEETDGAFTVRLEPLSGTDLLVNGEPAVAQLLAVDLDEDTDYLEAGDLQFHVIQRGDRFGVRAKHPEAESNLHFKGLEYFPADAAWRIAARFVAYEEPKTISIPSVIGTSTESIVPGEVVFERNGVTHTILPLNDGPDDPTFFYIFKDETSGKETYPAGRFLSGPAAIGDTVIIDFNQAYNPPCAFTPYATCPLPPKENRLAVAIEAGEKDYGEH
jgi:uncharacterized protein (DUF1684 family)